MSKWADFACLGFDLESTGVDTTKDRIITAALVEIKPGHRPAVSSYVVDPGVDISPEASEVNGYTRERAIAEATHTPEQMLFEITGRVAYWLGHGQPVVVFNGAFDFSMLEHENARHAVDTLVDRLGQGGLQPVVDVYVLDKFADPYRKGGRKLTQVCEHYGVRHVGAHEAAADALAACRLWPRIMVKHSRKFPGQTLQSLHQSQVQWRKAQMDSLRAYFDRQGTVHDGCDPGWPVYTSERRTTAVAS